ncbi:MAG: choice-of-anchor D domain-containing protein [Deltaproteobacteria bacterium]|nr:choice-of-anchor D domain-containing protein [Deltaproteobacteria bacterium]
MERAGMSCRGALVLAVVGLPFSGCECDEMGDWSAAGVLEPAAHNFGLVKTGERCVAELTLANKGQGGLTISDFSFVDKVGDFALDGIMPTAVDPYASLPLRIAYTAGDPGVGTESAAIKLVSNNPDNGGIISAALQGRPIASDAAYIATMCRVYHADSDEYVETNPCPELDFGATVVATSSPGVVRTLRLINDGTSVMTVLEPSVTGDFFSRTGASVPNTDGLGGMVEVTDWPIQLDPARVTCGGVSQNAKTYLDISVTFAPTVIGGAAGNLHIDTDAQVPPSSIDMALIGVGAGDGIEVDPPVLQFGEVAGGTSKVMPVRVYNLRNNQVAVNTSCLDINDNGVCEPAPTDIECTAVDESAVLSCGVYRADDTHLGKGFLLEQADATAGGEDEAFVKVRWAPTESGPLRTKLLLPTNIQNNRTWEVLVVGGSAGTLAVVPEPIVVPASGTPLHGVKDFVMTNTGQATLTIVRVALVATAPIITEQYELTQSGVPGFHVTGTTAWTTPFTINQGESKSFQLEYENDSEIINCEDANLYITHDGTGQNPAIVDIQVDGDNC